MNEKLTKMQKVVLLYVGVTAKNQDKKYLRRIDVIKGVVKILEYQEKHTNRISYSIRSLVKKNLLSIRGNTIGLTNRGRDTSRNIIDNLEKIYSDIDWDVIKTCYDLSCL